MRITLKTPFDKLELLVKVQYDYTKPIVKHSIDEHGRSVVTRWRERKTTVTCRKFDEEKNPDSMTLYVGTTVCDYRDSKKYTRRKGREIAWANAIAAMVEDGFINRDEADVLQAAGLSYTNAVIDMTNGVENAQICRKVD